MKLLKNNLYYIHKLFLYLCKKCEWKFIIHNDMIFIVIILFRLNTYKRLYVELFIFIINR